jgi:hypothetical protein
MRGLVGRERPRSAKGATAAPGEAIAVMLAKAVVAGVLPIIAGVVGSMPPVDVRKATLAQRAGPVRVTLAPCRVAPHVDFMRSMSQVRSHAMGRRGRHPASDNRTRSCSCHVSMLQSITGGGRRVRVPGCGGPRMRPAARPLRARQRSSRHLRCATGAQWQGDCCLSLPARSDRAPRRDPARHDWL